MFNPGSLRGDSEYDLSGPNRRLERVRNRMQDYFTGDEAAQRALDEATEATAEQRRAADRAARSQKPGIGARIRGWWSRRSSRS
jgi:hypothetical protein